MARFVKSEDKKRTATLEYLGPKRSIGRAAAATRKERGMERAAARAAGRTAAQEAAKAPVGKLSLGRRSSENPNVNHRTFEGSERTRMLTSSPPIRVTERFTNGKWVEVSRTRIRHQTINPPKKKGMSLGKAIESMQRKKPWN